jgi:Putative DNA-binding domain
MAASDDNHYKALLDEPNETLAVEYKEWLDLSAADVRADLARHIAALANHGGGTIVLGLTDSMQFAGENPFLKPAWNRDEITSIVKKYLEPTFQCDVRLIVSSAGNTHPVIIVPPHGLSPICAKANGPLVGNKTTGIVQGVHYTRKPGPESAPIQTAAEWAPIIRRCAMHDRAAIFGALDAALRGIGPPRASVADALKSWHDAGHKAFLQGASAQSKRPDLARSHWQVSYAIETEDGQVLRQQDLAEILRQVYAEVQDTVRSGWNMIDPHGVLMLRPYFETDPASGLGDNDFLEFSALRADQDLMFADMWRVSTDGKVTLIRDYWEDAFPQQSNPPIGTWISPNWMVRSLAEIVRHARAMTERFNSPTAISFRCEWHGLRDRKLHSPYVYWSRHSASRGDHKISTGSYPVTMLTNGWPEIVADLIAPLMRSFSADQVLIGPNWIRTQAPTWLLR